MPELSVWRTPAILFYSFVDKVSVVDLPAVIPGGLLLIQQVVVAVLERHREHSADVFPVFFRFDVIAVRSQVDGIGLFILVVCYYSPVRIHGKILPQHIFH